MLTIIKKVKLRLSNGIIYYLIASINVYFMCELLKITKIIKVNTNNFDNCISILKNDCFFILPIEKMESICDFLYHKENFSKFLKNLLYLVMTNIVLTFNLAKINFNCRYWIVVHLSALCFSLLNYISYFQFSLESKKSYSLVQLIIMIVLGLFFLMLLIRQAIRPKGLRYHFIGSIFCFYSFLYILLKVGQVKFKLHFHHSFCTGLLSICFTDFSSTINYYIHGILIGIVIQGINVYSINEIFPFDVKHHSSPDLNYMTGLFISYFLCWMLIILDFKIFCRSYSKIKKYCQKKEEFELLKIDLLDDLDR